MKLQVTLLFFILSNLINMGHIHAAEEADILGIWINQAGDGLTVITQQQGLYKGTIIGSTDGQDRYDIHNPNPQLRDRSLLGVKVLGDFKYGGNNKWKDGWVYDPNNGKTYSCKMKLIDDDTLEIRGYIGISLFGRTEVWKKTTPP